MSISPKVDMPASLGDEMLKFTELAGKGSNRSSSGSSSFTSATSSTTYSTTTGGEDEILNQLFTVLISSILTAAEINTIATLDATQTFSGAKLFDIIPKVTSYVAPTAENELTAKGYVDYSKRAVWYNSPSMDVSVAAGDCVLFNVTTSKWEKSQNGIGIYDGTNVITFGECILSGLTPGYNYYAQSDGSTTTDLNEFPVGYPVSSTILLVNIRGDYGNKIAYVQNMLSFFGIPRVSSAASLRVKMPLDADGVMIRRKSGSAWTAGDDETTGTLVANITNDSSYDDNNEWYQATGLTNGNNVYFKAFPYKGSVYNTTIGVNETMVIPRVGISEWTGDNISGSSIIDDIGSHNLTGINMTYNLFKIANGFDFSASGAYMRTAKYLPSTAITFNTWVNFTNTGEKYLFGENNDPGDYANWGWLIGIDGSGDVYLRAGDGTFTATAATVNTGLSINTTYMLTIVFNRSTRNIKVYVDGTYIGTATESTSINMTNVVNLYFGLSYFVGGLGYATTASMKLDQMRIYNIELAQADIDLLYNSGSGN